ncbi:acetate uptake transporter family protein [Salinisphaera sp.]|uniref:acetate uptake transporter family protein n=1 Tax=Salinisphaera sp. TaxID=1914330 RepID=UPI002D76D553|nr:GPR1/FUN34/YaaH family transporter [Salinisphaera sp.]HET7315717.1 GPR1/FUN34/YaaH family transporter [Salinisphaera sp.]
MSQELAGDDAMGRIYLQPIAAPSILGLYGFAAATFMVAAYMCGWYGGKQTPLYLAPFAAFFGGLAQFCAGMWAYKARDAIATAMHGTWGSFWMAWGLLNVLFATGALATPSGPEPGLAYWYFMLAAVTIMGAFAATAENAGLALVLYTLAAGALCLAIGRLIGSEGVVIAAGYVLVVSAVIAWYTASSLMFKGVGKQFLPLGMMPNVRKAPDVALGRGEPGVQRGQ